VTHTSDVSGAGTDANVFVVLYGEGGDSGKHALDASGRNDFEKGQRDEFSITCRDLGQLKKILIGHDNSVRPPPACMTAVVNSSRFFDR
jgi:lipoxygenase homology domain-containing protein 1